MLSSNSARDDARCVRDEPHQSRHHRPRRDRTRRVLGTGTQWISALRRSPIAGTSPMLA